MNTETLSAMPDLAALKSRQHAAWSAGDYAVIGTTIQIVGESLCEALDLRAGQKVLDVAAGNGNATLAAARRWCEVVSTDFVPALLERGRERAAAERLPVKFVTADAENLPCDTSEYDAVMSTFGVIFTAYHEEAASEMIRVCRPGGKIGMANWTPDGFIGQVFKTIGSFVPPAPGARSPALWGTTTTLDTLFGAHGRIVATPRQFNFRYRSPEHFLEVFRTWYGPVVKTYAALPAPKQEELTAALLALIGRFNRATDGTMVVPSDYLEVVITKA